MIGQAGRDLHQTLTVQVGNSTEMATLIDCVSQWTPSGSVAWSRQEYERRKSLLNSVKKIWITGFLQKSLHTHALIELGLETQADRVEIDHPFQDLSLTSEEPETAVTTDLSEVFNQNPDSRTLLILGEPGSGKTTLLLKLAEGLIEQTEVNLSRPIPIVLNLSSWAKSPDQQPSIERWLVQELQDQYRVPQKIGEQWVKDEQLLLLLDGLDEVRSEVRDACVQALNNFTQAYIATGVVICSRSQDYELLTTRLKLQTAVCIQSFTPEQILSHLQNSDESLRSLTQLLEQDVELLDLAKSPLILSVMSLAYAGVSSAELAQPGSIEIRRQRLFEAYIDRMFQRTGRYQGKSPYSQAQMLNWLTWLAQRMVQDSQSIFLIEKMQPTWLRSQRQRSLYRFGASCIFGFLFTSPICVVCGGLLAFLPMGDTESSFLLKLLTGILAGIIGGTFCWLLIGTMVSLFVWWKKFIDDEIRTIETIHWSWQTVRENLPINSIFGLVVGLLYGAVNWVNFLPNFVYGIFATIVILSLIQGFSSPEIQNKMQPNEGIKRSIDNARTIIVRSGLFGAIGLALFSLQQGIAITLFLAGIGFFFGLIPGFALASFGGLNAVIQHLMLRFLLFRDRCIPWNYARFLDAASEKIFLQKVGGGYVFIHRMLMEHFTQRSAE